MRKIHVAYMAVLGVTCQACGPDLQPEVDRLEAKVNELERQNAELRDEVSLAANTIETMKAPPPAFLDALYPPRADVPVLMMEMLMLNAAMDGLGVDLREGDGGNLGADFDAFKAQWEKLRNEVTPEWKDLYPMEPVEALGRAVEAGDPAKIGAALGEIGKSCGSCHAQHMQGVKFKYHWPDFDSLELPDPFTGKDVPYRDFMFGMTSAYFGMGHDLAQGQQDKAIENHASFSKAFDAMAEGCTDCHTSERAYFVSDDVRTDIAALGKALAAQPPDAEAVRGLSMKIAEQSCGGCHAVHMPAAGAKAAWKMAGK